MRALSLIRDLARPLIVAPMAGGPSSPALVAAASEAGALGSVGAAYLDAEQITALVASVRALTRRPIALNLFTPSPPVALAPERVRAAIEATRPFRAELGLPTPNVDPPFAPDFDLQFEAALRARPEALSFVFGVPAADYVKEARAAGIFLIGTATTLEEAQAVAAADFDAVVLQGVEAGGHRGTFDAEAADPDLSTRELVRVCAGRIQIPLIAAGGLMNAADLREVRALGADAVQMGTAFLRCREAGTSVPWRERLVTDRRTSITRVFSGRLARGLENRYTREAEESKTLPFPAQNAFTRDMRAASLARGSAEFLSLWCGAGRGVLSTASARDIIEQLFAGA